MKYPSSIQRLIDFFSDLPTVGPKTAERHVFYLLKKNPEELKKFALAIAELKNNITICQTCLAISESNPCAICADSKRDKSKICVVAGFKDMSTIEATKEFNGVYHILNGTLNSINGVKPEQLNIQSLLNKINKNQIKEIILALNPDLEGETTALYLNKAIKQLNLPALKITRLAKGLPMGADLEYADEITLGNAIKFRNEI